MSKQEEKPQPEASRKQADWGENVQTGRNFPTGSFEEASGLGENVQTGRKSPTGSKEEASRLGENVQTGRNSPTGSFEEASGLGGEMFKRDETPQPEASRKQAGWGKNAQTGKNSPTGSFEEASGLGGGNVQTGRNSPTGSFEEASGLGQKCPNGKKLPNRKQRGSKRVGAKMFKREETPQPEAKRKQADWGKNVQTGRNSPTGSKEEASGLGQKYPN